MYGHGLAVVLIISVGICNAQHDIGAGTVYRLNVVQDVWLEQPDVNYNSYQWLIVSKHTDYPKKRSLLQFKDIPTACTTVNHAMMYLYYAYSSKASWMTVNQVPFITRTIQAHRVLKSWNESQATTTKRYSSTSNGKVWSMSRGVQSQSRQPTTSNLWDQPYLGLDDTDANDCPTGQVTIYAERPAGFVEIDVTSAMKEWKAGKPNYGVLILATNENIDGRDTRFFSKSYSDPTKHAYIQLNCN